MNATNRSVVERFINYLLLTKLENQTPKSIKNVLLAIVILFASVAAFAQPDSLYIKENKAYDGPQWKQSQKASIDLSQVSFTNWNAGGTNSISALLGYQYTANYKDKFFFWNNGLRIGYGVNKQDSRELRKTDDIFEITSNLGHQPTPDSKWFYSARFNFKTQLTNGYSYPDTSNPISRLMAPGYLFFGGGMEYGKNIEELSFYASPLTLKATFVLDQELANAGSFGVDPAVFDENGNIIREGSNIRREVGILITNGYAMDLAKNIKATNLLSVYSDYLNNFGNIDVDWRVNFDFKVNSFVRATLESHLRYDDDVKTIEPSATVEGEFDESGARIQWKQFLGIGIAVDF
ncbi:Protein of unknown function [Hyunsoonleella jejuensis]|uniref:DUF3078 domain-containing protein n=1 Tax=Hyunsoonleella jejuensis TaxID=419940 RepID=A0A1H9GIK3_9FLAO|nr:DUF3078 domain-containing protein [Hyunsoonleella jejuensis]SEQ49718.1 Protein of unknown function [Hyunsoonleella jejuensis]